MKKITLSFLAGLILCGIITYFAFPILMFTTHKSANSFEETIAKIEAQVKEQGWVQSGISKISKSVKKHGGGDLPNISVIKVCQPDHAYNILKIEKFRHLSAMMPCSIAVYENDDGEVYVSHFNTKVMGAMFPNPVRHIMMGDVHTFLEETAEAATQ